MTFGMAAIGLLSLPTQRRGLVDTASTASVIGLTTTAIRLSSAASYNRVNEAIAVSRPLRSLTSLAKTIKVKKDE